MKKILFLTHYSDLYGANLSLASIVCGLKDISGIVVYPEHGELSHLLKTNNIKSVKVKFFNMFGVKNLYLKNTIKLIFNIPPLIYLIYIIRKEKINLIYSNSLLTIYGYFAARLLRLPYILHIRENVANHYNWEPVFGNSHLQKILQNVDTIIYISNYLKKEYNISSNNNQIVIYNGVFKEKDIPAVARTLGANNKNEIILTIIGSIYPSKGQLEGITAFSKLIKKGYKLNLRIVGKIEDDKYFNECLNYVENNNLNDSVVFVGHIGSMKEIYDATDIVIICSILEGMSRVLAESMSLGIPVIGKKSGALIELINDNTDGLLYETTDDLSEKIEKLLKDYKLYDYISQNGIQKAKNIFTIEKYLSSINMEILKFDK